MLVSRFIAIAFRDCARGLAQVHLLAQKAALVQDDNS